MNQINKILCLLLVFACWSCAYNAKTEKCQDKRNNLIKVRDKIGEIKIEDPGDSSIYYAIPSNEIKVDFDKPVEPSVFDYFKSVELIPLETSDDVLIGRIRKLLCYGDRYYTLDT